MAAGIRFTPSVSWRLSLLLIFLLAVAWRALFILRLGRSAVGYDLAADGEIYWGWAGHLLTHSWRSDHPFFFGPLYPYFLAGIAPLIGHSVFATLALQSVFGSVSSVLLADAARRLTRPSIGLALGILLAGYGMAVFMDAQVLTESLLFLFASLLLWLVVRMDWSRPDHYQHLGVAVLVALMIQGRATALVLVPLTTLTLLWVRSAGKVRATSEFVGLVLLLLLPTTWHNFKTAREWIPVTYNLGYNLYVGNNPEATGSFVLITGAMEPRATPATVDGGIGADGRDYLAATTGHEYGYGESSRRWFGMATEWIRANPISFARLSLRKVAMLWNRREYPQIESPEMYQQAAGPMGVPYLGTFAVLGILAFPGWSRLWKRGPPGRFIVGYLVLLTIVTVPFFVTDRYRIHLVPAIALAAAVGAESIWASLKRPTLRSGSLTLVSMGLGAAFILLPLPERGASLVVWDSAADLGSRWLARGNPERAVQELQHAVSIEESGALPPSGGATARAARAGVYADLGLALRQLGRMQESAHWLRRAFDLVPGRPQASALATGQVLAGDVRGASLTYATVSIAPAEGAASLLDEARRAQQGGQQTEVEPLVRGAVELYPQLYFGWLVLTRLDVQRQQFDRAQVDLEDGRRNGMGDAPYYSHAAFVAAARGDRPRAAQLLDRVPPGERANPELAEVIAFVRSALATPKR